MSPTEKLAAEKAEIEKAKIELARMGQIAARVFSSPDGIELLTHLWQRFDVPGRTFLMSRDGAVCPLRAALRDGERAAVNYLLTLAAEHDPGIYQKIATTPKTKP